MKRKKSNVVIENNAKSSQLREMVLGSYLKTFIDSAQEFTGVSETIHHFQKLSGEACSGKIYFYFCTNEEEEEVCKKNPHQQQPRHERHLWNFNKRKRVNVCVCVCAFSSKRQNRVRERREIMST